MFKKAGKSFIKNQNNNYENVIYDVLISFFNANISEYFYKLIINKINFDMKCSNIFFLKFVSNSLYISSSFECRKLF